MGSPRINWRRLGPAAAAAVLAVLAQLAGPSDAAAQCSLCRDAVASSPPQIREAMNYAIIGLAFAPYGVAALAAWTLSPALRAQVRARVKRLSFRRPENPS